MTYLIVPRFKLYQFCEVDSNEMEISNEHKYFGYEYISPILIFGIPLIHISFRYQKLKNGFIKPIPAKGIIAIGQVAVGTFNVSQFGLGIFNVSQFSIAVYSVCQIGIGYSLIAQVGLFFDYGYGQAVATFQEFIFLVEELLGIY